MVRRKQKTRIYIIMLLLTGCIIAFVAFFGFRLWMEQGMAALDPGNTTAIQVIVPSGTSTKGIGTLLESNGLIADPNFFVIVSKIEGNDGKYKAGDYTLSPGMTLDEIIELLLIGQEQTVRFTIPEGYDIRRTTDALAEKDLINREVFIDILSTDNSSYRFLEGIPSGENRLEGFLYPETYEIFSNASEQQIIDKMLKQFDLLFTEKHYARAKELGLSIREIVTLASVIEREAVISKDRPVIAGVFYNRLELGMPLQSCATVQYILGEQKPVLSTADTRIESPYNTYLHNGLPPAPICSPGIESIDAALWPFESDYLYFLAKGDGSHVFSITYDEHLRNKAIYIDNK